MVQNREELNGIPRMKDCICRTSLYKLTICGQLAKAARLPVIVNYMSVIVVFSYIYIDSNGFGNPREMMSIQISNHVPQIRVRLSLPSPGNK